MSDFVEHVLNRTKLRIEHGFLDATQTVELSRRIERAVPDIEEFLNMKFDTTHYKERHMIVHLFDSRCISHVKGGYLQVATPYIYMSLDEPRSDLPKGPYLHEIVHVIAWEWHDLWIREGLAVFLNDELSGYPTYPNYGLDLDATATQSLSDPIGQQAIALVGSAKKVPESILHDFNVRQAFYVQAGAFVKHLWKRVGREIFLQMYRSKDPNSVFQQFEGQSLLEEKTRWIESMRAATTKKANIPPPFSAIDSHTGVRISPGPHRDVSTATLSFR